MDNTLLHASPALDAESDLDALYDKPGWVAFASEVDHINAQYRSFIEAAPFVALSTNGPNGPDCSARGGEAGFVEILDEKTLILPDRPGNNRIDSMRNLVHDPKVALLFLIPGCRESLRVKGRARIVRPAQAIRVSGEAPAKQPKSLIAISVESVHFQCAGAIKRARLWECERAAQKLPTPNGILAGLAWRGLLHALRLGGRRPQAARARLGDEHGFRPSRL